MKSDSNLQFDVRLLPILGEAIDRWLAARDKAIAVTSSENQHAYNATLFELGAAWAERYPDSANTPEAFEWYRRGLIGAEED